MTAEPGSLFAPLWAFVATHGVILPIVLPLVAGSLLVVLEKAGSRWVGGLALASTLLLLVVSLFLLRLADSGVVTPYLLGNWQAPYGISLALDRLSALMVLLTAGVALVALLYALGGDDQRTQRPARHFHALFQYQLMGLNGAFLTADLFNLFVFFEVLLAASYGLLLHGATRGRVKASVHYVVFNLTGSALFLVAVSLLYALTGTLNMADLAVRLPQLAPENARLAQAAALMLLVVFAVKAALLPLYFWLPETYANAPAPTAALFAIMTKVGVYAILRSTTLMFPASAEGSAVAGVAGVALPVLALATLVLAAVGALAAVRLRGLVAYLVVASAGTLLLAVGLATPSTVAAALFYLVPSTLVAAAWFLLADRIAGARAGSDLLQPRALAGSWAGLGLAFFVAAVAVAGVPPLAAFMGKALLLQAAGATPLAPWVVALVLGSSLAVMVALARAGAVLFWTPDTAAAPAGAGTVGPKPAAALQRVALVLALGAVVACAPLARPLSRYAHDTAAQLFTPGLYQQAVLGAQPVSPAYDVRRELNERVQKGLPK